MNLATHPLQAAILQSPAGPAVPFLPVWEEYVTVIGLAGVRLMEIAGAAGIDPAEAVQLHLVVLDRITRTPAAANLSVPAAFRGELAAERQLIAATSNLDVVLHFLDAADAVVGAVREGLDRTMKVPPELVARLLQAEQSAALMKRCLHTGLDSSR